LRLDIAFITREGGGGGSCGMGKKPGNTLLEKEGKNMKAGNRANRHLSEA